MVDMFTKSRPGLAEALEVCGRCPVLVDCRTAAIERAEMHGVWGGLDQTALRQAVRLHVKRRRGAR